MARRYGLCFNHSEVALRLSLSPHEPTKTGDEDINAKLNEWSNKRDSPCNRHICLSPENKYAEAAYLECDNNTVLHTVLEERKNCNYLNKKNNATECLITTLSHGGVGTIGRCTLFRIRKEVIQSRVTALSFRGSSGF